LTVPARHRAATAAEATCEKRNDVIGTILSINGSSDCAGCRGERVDVMHPLLQSSGVMGWNYARLSFLRWSIW